MSKTATDAILSDVVLGNEDSVLDGVRGFLILEDDRESHSIVEQQQRGLRVLFGKFYPYLTLLV